jgi:uncharacterized protein
MKPSPHVEVRRSSAGLGLFATRDIPKETFIIEYKGEKITTDEADRRGGKYLFDVKKGLVIDGKARTNTARYINHSCRPNCYAEIDEDAEKVRIFSKRNIKVGEELTYNYGKKYWRDFIEPYGCRCEKCLGN